MLKSEIKKGTFSSHDCKPFNELYNRYKKRIFNYIYSLGVKNIEAAEDILQETFIRIFRDITKFRKGEKFSTWIYKIASSLTKNYFKKISRDREKIDEAKKLYDETIMSNLNDDLHKKELFKKIEEIKQELPFKLRAAFVLKFDQELKYSEIADIMGCSVRWAKKHVEKALNIIRTKLKEMDY